MKKQHKPQPIPFENLPSSQSFNWEALTFWLTEHIKAVIIGIVALFLLLPLAYTFLFGQFSNGEADYFKAADAFQTFVDSSETKENQQQALQTLTALISKRPELHAAYDGLIAQTLINRGQPQEAEPFAQSAITRTSKNDLNTYTDFAQTTLLIGNKNFNDALAKTENLTHTLTSNLADQRAHTPAFGEVLFAFNLLRQAMLNQKTGHEDKELKTWENWKTFQKDFPATYEKVAGQFAAQKISLADYIESRLKILKK